MFQCLCQTLENWLFPPHQHFLHYVTRCDFTQLQFTREIYCNLLKELSKLQRVIFLFAISTDGRTILNSSWHIKFWASFFPPRPKIFQVSSQQNDKLDFWEAEIFTFPQRTFQSFIDSCVGDKLSFWTIPVLFFWRDFWMFRFHVWKCFPNIYCFEILRLKNYNFIVINSKKTGTGIFFAMFAYCAPINNKNIVRYVFFFCIEKSIITFEDTV